MAIDAVTSCYGCGLVTPRCMHCAGVVGVYLIPAQRNACTAKASCSGCGAQFEHDCGDSWICLGRPAVVPLPQSDLFHQGGQQ